MLLTVNYWSMNYEQRQKKRTGVIRGEMTDRLWFGRLSLS
jgi:hypothetical protein